MNFTAKILSTFARRFSDGEQQFSKVQIRFRQDDFAYPIFDAIEYNLPDSPDGWPTHFRLSDKATEFLQDSGTTGRRLLWWELEGEVPADYAAEVIVLAKTIAVRHWLLKKSVAEQEDIFTAPTKQEGGSRE